MVEPDGVPKLTPKQTARFKKIVMPHLAIMLRAAQYMTHRKPEAEDLVQEAAIKAMRAIDQFQDGTDAKAWLMTILWRVHIDAQRSGKHRAKTMSIDQAEMDLPDRKPILDTTFDPQKSKPETLMERFSDKEIIDALKSLPEEIRWTLLLVDIELMNHADAAKILEVPTGTIKSRVHRGRAMLHKQLHQWAQKRGWGMNQESGHG